MSEEKSNLSVDEILESLRLTKKGGSVAVEDIFEEETESADKNSAVFTDDSDEEEMDSSTVFGQYDESPDGGDDSGLLYEEQETAEEAGKEERPVSQSGEDEEASAVEQSEETAEETESEESAEKPKDNAPSFKELFLNKKREKENAGKTRIFSKPEAETAAADEKTRVISEKDESGEEDELEKKFNESRQEKIDNFRLFTENISDSPIAEESETASASVLDSVRVSNGEDIFTAIDKVKKPKKENVRRSEIIKKRNSKVYEKIDVGRVKLRLKNESDKQKLQTIVLLVTLVLLAVLEILKSIYTAGSLAKLSVIMDSKCVIFYTLSLLFSLPALAVSVSDFINRLKNSEKFEFTNELYLLVINVCNLFHSSVMLALRKPVEKNTLMFSVAVCFIMLMSQTADSRENKMILKNLNTITKNEKLLGIYSLTKDAEKLAGGISSSKEPNILCAGEVEVPDSFMDSSTIKDKQNAYLRVVTPLMLLFGLICGAVSMFTYGGIGSFSLGMISAVLLCSPAFLTTVLSKLIANANEHLNISGCEILGYEAVEYIDDIDAIVLDTADIFSGEISHFHIINSRAGINTLNAFRTVCAMLSVSQGVLAKEVESLMQEQKLDLPEVEDLKYEEKLGLSCWVDNKCALLGTRQMMINHNIEVPPEYMESSYIQEGKKIFYFAVDTQVVAMFCAEYFIGRQAKRQLEKLYKTGVILMLMTTDPNIDEEFVARTLGVDPNSIKTVSSTGTQIIKKEIDITAKQKRTGLIFKRNITGLLRVINTAFRLYDVQYLTMLIQGISVFFAFVLALVLNIFATGYFVSEWLIIGYHLIWTLLTLVVTSRK
ncbi:MAG: hypothetical protein PUB94_01670 [Oscillospiraceae bacterium]|nr:hypothetical protein [Oscillospiraceae bacterium]